MDGNTHSSGWELEAIGWRPDENQTQESLRARLAILREFWTGRKAGCMVLFSDRGEIEKAREQLKAVVAQVQELFLKDPC